MVVFKSVKKIMKEIPGKIEDLLNRYYHGRLDKAGERELFEWLKNRPDGNVLLEEAKTRNTVGVLYSEETHSAWEKLSAKTNKKSATELSWLLIKYAAIFLLIFGGGSATYHYFLRSEAAGELFTTIEMPYGERGKVVLPDSTIILMNSGSILRYPVDFSNSNRRIEFEGEGYFEVARSDEPFIIYSDPVRVNVLGTKFNLMSYPEDGLVETTLYEGSLTVGHKTDQYRTERNVRPGQRVVLVKKDLSLTAFNILPGTEGPGWIFNHMIFENSSFQEVIRQLERKFNYDIDLNNEEAESLHYTGRFVNDEDLDDILYVIEKASPIELSFSKSGLKRIISIK